MRFNYDRQTAYVLRHEASLCEAMDKKALKKFVFNKNNWVINDYKSFVKSVNKSKRKEFLSDHPVDELKNPEWTTFQLKGESAGFALHYTGKGEIDICNLHNNSSIKGLGSVMLDFAKSLGGNKMDNYAGFLGDLYQKHGFDKYEEYQWDDQFRPDNWDEDTYGKPNVEFRRDQIHQNKYNNNDSYKKLHNKKIRKTFKGAEITDAVLGRIVMEAIQRLKKGLV